MKKSLQLLLFFACLAVTRASAQFTITNLNFSVQHADVAAVDINGDGDLDIIISGEDTTARKLQLFYNDGSGNFTPVSSPFPAVTRTTFDWDDINGDGNLDMIMSGFTAAGPPIDSVYTSDGNGNFTVASNIVLPQMAPSSGFADLNNDGYTDIYVFGNKFEGHPKIFFNNKAGGFTESAQFEAYNFVDPDVTEVDFDNDKDIDLFVNAGFEDAVNGRFSKMFVNTNGVFTEMNLGLIPKGNGSAVWGDYDNNGYLDLLLNGDGFLGSGEDNDFVYRLYSNNAGTFTAITTFTKYRQNSTGDGGRFADWDNDGDLDVIVTGYNDSAQRQATDIYLNNGGVFTPYSGNEQTPGVSESSIEVADVDQDSDLDLLVTGFSGNEFNATGTAFNSNVSLIIQNPATLTNVAPNTPTNLNVTGNQASLTFSWTAATDATTPQNALSYNMFLVNDQGKTFIYSLSDTATGELMVQRLGNVQLNKGWIIKNLTEGNYSWGVQAIDNSFMGSTFAKSSFTINADGTLPVSITYFNVKAEGNKAKLEWETAFEQNSDRFEIERSKDGRNFSKLASVKAKGTSTVANQYVMYDNAPLNGMNYYRLMQYDLDARATDYGIKNLNFNLLNHPSVIAYPNPAHAQFGISLSNFTGTRITVTMTDMMGKMIYHETIPVNSTQAYYKLNLTTKPVSGQYLLYVLGDDLNESVKVLVK